MVAGMAIAAAGCGGDYGDEEELDALEGSLLGARCPECADVCGPVGGPGPTDPTPCHACTRRCDNGPGLDTAGITLTGAD
jgi:hypothetical protein